MKLRKGGCSIQSMLHHCSNVGDILRHNVIHTFDVSRNRSDIHIHLLSLLSLLRSLKRDRNVFLRVSSSLRRGRASAPRAPGEVKNRTEI